MVQCIRMAKGVIDPWVIVVLLSRHWRICTSSCVLCMCKTMTHPWVMLLPNRAWEDRGWTDLANELHQLQYSAAEWPEVLWTPTWFWKGSPLLEVVRYLWERYHETAWRQACCPRKWGRYMRWCSSISGIIAGMHSSRSAHPQKWKVH